MLRTLHVGIDIGHQEHVVCLVDASGERIGKPFAITNNPGGVQQLTQAVDQACSGYDQVVFGLEATGIYWWHLARSLQRQSATAAPARRVIVYNPVVVQGFRKVYTSMEKTDPQDAFIIAQRVRFGTTGSRSDYPLPDPHYFPLQRLTRFRHFLVHSLVRTKLHTLTLLFLAESEYERLRPLSDPFGATSLALLTEYHGLDELAELPLATLVEFLDEHSRGKIDNPESLAKQLQQISADSFKLDDEAVGPVRFVLRSALQQVKSQTQALKALDRQLAAEFERYSNTLCSVKGLGPVYAAGLTAEIGDIGRYQSDEALAKYAGLWWPRSQSGQFDSEDRHLAKTGNAHLRYYFCEAANSLRQHDECYRQFYNRKYQETLKHKHKRACVLTARKLVRLVYALLRNNQSYDPAKGVSRREPTTQG